MSKRKSDHSYSDSDSDSDSSFEGTSIRTNKKKKRRTQRHLAHSLKEVKEDVVQLRRSVEVGMRKLAEELNELKNALLQTRPLSIRVQGKGRNLKLQCKTKLDKRVYTNNKIIGDQGSGIDVMLIDADTDRIITTGLESSIKVQVVVLKGDFNREDHDNWSREEFDGCKVQERWQKGPLLIGELQTTLKEGVGSLINLTFTDNSSWQSSKKFRIGVQVAPGYCEGTRIREALTEPFRVREQRGELYEKHYPPMSSDYVWRLESIAKDGQFHKRLEQERIYSVEKFLQAYNRDEQTLRNILGNGMTRKNWNALVDHAKTCPPDGKHFLYCDAERNYDLLFDNFAHFVSLVLNGIPRPINLVPDSEKEGVDESVKKAYQNWKDVTEYAGFIQRGISSHPVTVAAIPGMRRGIAPIHSFGLHDFPIQISLPDYGESSKRLNRGSANLLEVNADSDVANEQASMPQQIGVQEGKTPMSHPLVWPASSFSSHLAPRSPYSSEHFNVDDLLALSPGDSLCGGTYNADELFSVPDTHNNLYSWDSFNSNNFPVQPDFTSGKKAIIGWLMVKAVLKWGFFSRKRSGATLIEV